ncbi:MAG: response regulator [Candidatus Heimdallarchaeaceae archaeon]
MNNYIKKQNSIKKQLKLLNEELERRVKKRTSQIETLYNIIRDISQTFDLQKSMEILSKYISNLVPCDVIAEILTKEGVNLIHLKAPQSFETQYNNFLEKIKTDFSKLNPNIVDNRDIITVEKTYDKTVKIISSLISLPLIAEDEIVGIISIGSSMEDVYSKEEIWFLYQIADAISQTLQRQKVILSAKEELETVLNHMYGGCILLNFEKQIVLTNNKGKEFLRKLELEEGLIFESDRLDINVLMENKKMEISIDDRFYIVSIDQIKTDFIYGWLLNILDITEEKQFQQKIIRQERLATVGQLSAGISHEFNNILASIMGAAEFVLTQVNDDNIKKLLNIIIKQSEKGATIVQKILDFSRKATTQKKAIKIQDFIEEVHSFIRASISENINLSFDVDDLIICIDPNQLEQILLNLYLNAKDALPSGGEIELSVKKVDSSKVKDFEIKDIDNTKSYVHFRLEDNGIGMSDSILKRVFEPFFTTKNHGKGSGLGLSQVYGLVRKADGYINIESEEGVGTVVHIFFHENAETISLSKEKEEHEINSKPIMVKNKTILLVEDNDEVREMTKILLERSGYKTETASNGKEALRIYKQGLFDLVITDIIMPEMDGNELIEEIKKFDPNCKFLAMTGYSDVEISSDVKILHKPIKRNTLLQVIKEKIQEII